MSDPAPAPAHRTRFHDSTFLLAIAVVALVLGTLSLYLQGVERPSAVTATASDERPSTPLPAGPRKYQ